MFNLINECILILNNETGELVERCGPLINIKLAISGPGVKFNVR